LSGKQAQRHSTVANRWVEFTEIAAMIYRGTVFYRIGLARPPLCPVGLIFVLASCHNIAVLAIQPDWANHPVATDEKIVAAMRIAGDGYSVDEIVIDDDRRERLLDAINPDWHSLGDAWQRDTLLRLMSLRKAGKIDLRTTSRGRNADHQLAQIAEIAARSVLDRNPVSTDALLCDPRLRNQLQVAAIAIAGPSHVGVVDAGSVPGDSSTSEAVQADAIDAYSIRKHLLQLRKKRQLRPELVQRVADWDRKLETFSLEQLKAELISGNISTGAGVYLFYDPTGYLYIGETANLKTRLTQHTNHSDRLALDQYLQSSANGSVTVELHTFGKRSPANELAVRRAYESELIRTRQPRLNVRP
jgi:hypothetical protein